MRVSVICPLYKGEKYIQKIINIVVQNYENAKTICNLSMEIIFINDYMNEEIDIFNYQRKDVDIKYLKNKDNKGIHYSRVRGLEIAEGDYIVFLDQDDDLNENYIKSQILKIKDYDAVVCNGINLGCKIYYSEKMIKSVCDRLKYLQGKNLIISPGQVLLKKAAIPKEWRRDILVNNGADDYFLWMLMMLKGKRFTYNYSELYRHNTTGENTSDDFDMMKKSVYEMFNNLYKERLLSKSQYIEIKNRYNSSYKDINSLFRLYQRSSRVQVILDVWLTNKQDGKSVVNFLKKNDITSVVIYGCGLIGRHLIKELDGTSIEVEAVMDRDKARGMDGVNMINLGDMISTSSTIIITPVMNGKEIQGELQEYYKNRIFFINQLVEDMC